MPGAPRGDHGQPRCADRLRAALPARLPVTTEYVEQFPFHRNVWVTCTGPTCSGKVLPRAGYIKKTFDPDRLFNEKTPAGNVGQTSRFKPEYSGTLHLGKCYSSRLPSGVAPGTLQTFTIGLGIQYGTVLAPASINSIRWPYRRKSRTLKVKSRFSPWASIVAAMLAS